jgi:hypothetical protein
MATFQSGIIFAASQMRPDPGIRQATIPTSLQVESTSNLGH